MNTKSFAFLLAAVGVILLSIVALQKASLFNKKGVVSPSPTLVQTPVNDKVKVIISAPDENFLIEYVKDDEESSQAFSVLKEALEKNNIPLEVENYDFGVFVKSINGIESTNEKAWIYFVNGESGQVAADKMNLEKGDLVEWRYITPSE